MTDARPVSPWPGLYPYLEEDRERFRGRRREIIALLRAVQREPITVLYGQSGLGKTSLLQAGLFPELRQHGAFPVLIRLDFDSHAPPLTDQVLAAIDKAADTSRTTFADSGLRITAPPRPTGERPELSLWAYFHRRDRYFWSEESRLATPVLVFDQFEEWFTRGTERRTAFLEELSQLLDNRPPDGLRTDGDWTYERVPLAVVFSLREDYLAHLASLAEFLPGLRANELRLTELSEDHAREVIEEPASAFWAPDPLFTDEVLTMLRGTTPVEADYDPAILSLLLNRLFDQLRNADGVDVRRRIIRDRGQDVLLDFYESALSAAKVKRRERQFVEEELVTSHGLRNSIAFDDATNRHRVRAQVLNRLREERLLHFDERALGHQRVELAHDVLCGVARRSRQIRLARRRKRQTIVASTIVAIALIVTLIVYQKLRGERLAFDAISKLVDRATATGGVPEESLQIYQKALADGILGVTPDALKKSRDVARGLMNLGERARDTGNLTVALEAYRTALEIRKKIAGSDSSHIYTMKDLGDGLMNLGERARDAGNLTVALEAYRAALEIRQKIADSDPSQIYAMKELGDVHSWLGIVLESLGKLSEALIAYHTHEAIVEQLAAKASDNPDWLRELAVAHNRVGVALRDRGDLGGALTKFRAARAILEKLVATAPDKTAWLYELGLVHRFVGNVLEAGGDLAAALTEFEADKAVFEKLAAKAPEDTDWLLELGVAHGFVGSALEARGDLAGALTASRTAKTILEKLVAKVPENADWLREAGTAHIRLGVVQEARRDLAAALAEFQAGRAAFAKLVVKTPDNVDWQRWLSLASRRIGDAQTRRGDLNAALIGYAEARSTTLRLLAQDPNRPDWQSDIARIHAGLGHAYALRREAVPALTELKAADDAVMNAVKQSPENASYAGLKGLVALRMGQALLAGGRSQREAAVKALGEGRDDLLRLGSRAELTREQREWLAELEKDLAALRARRSHP